VARPAWIQKPNKEASPTTDITDGRIVAMLIDSTVLGEPIWFAFRDDWRPGDGDSIPVFCASELPALRDKTPEQLRKIYALKVGPKGLGTRVKQ